jgi:hypothetical protein
MNCPHQAAIADTIVIAFYFLLRVGEYTAPRQAANIRTTPIRGGDIRLWAHHTQLAPTLPITVLLQAVTQVSIQLCNQKNGQRNTVIAHNATRQQDCPVAAVIRRIHHLYQNAQDPNNAILTTFFLAPHTTGTPLRASEINAVLKQGAID